MGLCPGSGWGKFPNFAICQKYPTIPLIQSTALPSKLSLALLQSGASSSSPHPSIGIQRGERSRTEFAVQGSVLHNNFERSKGLYLSCSFSSPYFRDAHGKGRSRIISYSMRMGEEDRIAHFPTFLRPTSLCMLPFGLGTKIVNLNRTGQFLVSGLTLNPDGSISCIRVEEFIHSTCSTHQKLHKFNNGWNTNLYLGHEIEGLDLDGFGLRCII